MIPLDSRQYKDICVSEEKDGCEKEDNRPVYRIIVAGIIDLLYY